MSQGDVLKYFTLFTMLKDLKMYVMHFVSVYKNKAVKN